MRYNNKFFSSEAEAKAFRKEHGGKLIRYTPKTHIDFYAEIAVARDARGESVDPDETPYCVAWNEKT